MATWMRLTEPLPREILTQTDLSQQLTSIATWQNCSLVGVESLHGQDYPRLTWSDLEMTGEGWFSIVRKQLADNGLSLARNQHGLVITVQHTNDENQYDHSHPEPPTVVYNVTDLWVSPARLAESINELIHPDTWEINGGELDADTTAVTTREGRFLIVRNHEDTHGAIMQFLESLATLSVDACASGGQSGRDAALSCGVRNSLPPDRQRLVGFMQTSTPPQLRGTPSLAELLDRIRQLVGACRSDAIEQDPANFLLDLRVDFGSLYNDLNHALSQYQLVLLVGQYGLEITESAQSAIPEVVVYDVTSLRGEPQTLKQIVMNHVSPSEWDEHGGPGQLIHLTVRERSLLAVRNTPNIQWQVRRFLERLSIFLAAPANSLDRIPLPSTPIALATPPIAANHPRPAEIRGSTVVTVGDVSQPPTSPIRLSDTIRWRNNRLLSDFWPPGESSDNVNNIQYPVFFDVTDLKMPPYALEALIMAMIWPADWEEQGGQATLDTYSLADRKLLVTSAALWTQQELGYFLDNLSDVCGVPRPRTNLEVSQLFSVGQWTGGLRPRSEGLIFAQIHDVSATGSDPESLRQHLMNAVAPDSWLDHGGDFEVTHTKILGKTLLFVRHHPHIQRHVDRIIQQNARRNGTSQPVLRRP